jgi:methylated-DNA-[protein]-cysteine S-methyltransferase
MKKPFNHRVWDACKHIPSGRVSTYKEIGDAIGTKGYRAVGNALNKNPYAPTVPCHRVVKSDGSLGGFGGGIRRKASLLANEGITLSKGRINNFKEKIIRLSNN